MPVYDVYCDCGNEEEVYLKLDQEAPLCSKCGHRMKKAISCTTFILKGSGWYADGYNSNKIKGK